MADGWADAFRFVDGIAALSERLVAEEVRYHIDGAWPIDTGWSAANNRIGDETGGVPLEPPERPTQSGALVAEAQANLATDLAALRAHVKPASITIGNAVPYAPDVGWLDGNGQLIYMEAGKTGASVGVARVGQEWQREVPR